MSCIFSTYSCSPTPLLALEGVDRDRASELWPSCRAIISDRAGTVTVFAFDEGEGLSEHMAPYDALLQLLEGEAEVTVAGNGNLMEQGEAIILPAGKPHAVQALRKCKILLTMIRSK